MLAAANSPSAFDITSIIPKVSNFHRYFISPELARF